jgi:hypothetical protein
MVLSRKPFGVGHTHTHIYTFLLRMTDTVASQNIGLSFWDTLYRTVVLPLVLYGSGTRRENRDQSVWRKGARGAEDERDSWCCLRLLTASPS